MTTTCTFGANCNETSPVVKKYVRSLLHQVVDLEKKTYQIENWLTITFKLEELRNDMKMLAMLSGELSISAKYFSPFANVSKDDNTSAVNTRYNCNALQATCYVCSNFGL